MKTIVQIRESLDRPVALSWKKSVTKGTIEATGKLRDRQSIKVVFADTGYHTDIAFSVGNTTKQTGKGNSLEVFATVWSAIETFMRKYDKPETLSFTSDKEDSSKDSRGKLYMTLARRLAKTFNYDVETDQLGPFTIFILKRK